MIDSRVDCAQHFAAGGRNGEAFAATIYNALYPSLFL
jgi:hypothetical protein